MRFAARSRGVYCEQLDMGFQDPRCDRDAVPIHRLCMQTSSSGAAMGRETWISTEFGNDGDQRGTDARAPAPTPANVIR